MGIEHKKKMMVECIIDESDPFYDQLKFSPMLNNETSSPENFYGKFNDSAGEIGQVKKSPFFLPFLSVFLVFPEKNH